MVVAVGVTIAGSGIFSLFYATEAEPSVDSPRPEPPMSAARRHARTGSPEVSPIVSSGGSIPPWWEGPVPPARNAGAPSMDREAPPIARDPPSAGISVSLEMLPPIPSPGPNGGADSGRDEIETALEELESISRDITAPAVPGRSTSPPVRRTVDRCSDCGRTLSEGLAERWCVECARPLCPDCGQTVRGGAADAVVCQRCHPVRS
jgi:hypothetical protein